MFKVIFFSVFLLTVSSAINPGVKVRLNQRGLNFAANKALDVLARKLLRVRLPNVDQQRTRVTNIRITRFVKPSARVSIIPGSGISLRLTRGLLALVARFRRKVWFFWVKGSISASSKDISLSMKTMVSQRNGKPRLRVRACRVTLGKFKINLSGSILAWFANVFKFIFKGTIRKKLEWELCIQMIRLINVNANLKLSSLNLVASIYKNLKLNYHLTANPTLLYNRVETSHHGKMYFDPQSDFNPPRMSTLNDRMISISISENTLNSIARAVHRRGLLTWKFPLPKLDTREVSGNQTLNANIIFTSAPICSITPSKLQIKAPVEVYLRGNAVRYRIKTEVSADVNVYFSGNRMRSRVNQVNIRVISVQPSSPQVMAGLTKALSSLEILARPTINNQLRRGFPLPTVARIVYFNFRTVRANRYIQIAANVR